MSIQSLCVATPSKSVINNVEDFIEEFTYELGKSVRDEIVNTDKFWETARRIMTSADTKAKQEAFAADFQRYLSNVASFPVSYYSQQGDKLTLLSGKIYIPRNAPTRNIIIAHHYTIGADREAPSQTTTFEALLAAKGYIVLMPDYMGFGISRDSIQPYLNATMAAQASIDLLNASISFLYDRNVHIDSPELILCGYSQGAAASLAVQRLIETSYPEYSIRKNFLGAGPYRPADTYDYYIQADETSIACAIPMLLQGMLVSEHLDYHLEDLLLPPLRENYPDWINSKTYTINQINVMIGSKRISEILSPLARDKSRFPTNTFYQALQRNTIDGWKPVGDIYMFHSLNDDMVPVINSINTQQYFDSLQVENITYDFSEYGTHMDAALIFFQNLYRNL